MADQHLGYRQYGLVERQDDHLIATAYAFHRAKELKVDAIHMGGDMFQTLYPPASAVYFLAQQVAEAKQAGIAVVGIDGNHDTCGSAWLQVTGIHPLDWWIDGIPTCTNLNGVLIFGINGGRAATVKQRLAEAVKHFTETKQMLPIVSLHLPLAELCGFQNVETTAIEIAAMLQPLGTKLVLLGDIHDYKETDIGGIRFIYSGSVEVTACDEQMSKTFSIIDWDVATGTFRTEIHPIPIRPWINIHIAKAEELDTLLAQITANTQGNRKPLAFVTFNTDIPDFVKRAEQLLHDRALYRLVPAPKNVDLDIFKRATEQTFERKGALRTLKDIVYKEFGDTSDETSLVLRILDQPDAVPQIIEDYAKSKGLDVKVQS